MDETSIKLLIIDDTAYILNGVTEFNIALDRIKQLENEIKAKNGKFKIILINKSLNIDPSLEDDIAKTEAYAIKET